VRIRRAMMSKTKSKEKQPLNLQLNQHLREGLLILASALALFLLLSLVSYHKTDPGFFHLSSHHHIVNTGGRIGAWFSDVFFMLFGYMAYVFPFMLAWSAGLFLRALPERPGFDQRTFVLRSIGFLIILIAGSGIASLQFAEFNAHLPYTAGGMLGHIVGVNLSAALNISGSSLLLLALFCSGITLFTGLSWIALMDALGKYTLQLFSITINVIRWLSHTVKFKYQTYKAARIKKAKQEKAAFKPLKV
ncbi:unnamed protein product, partial [marine sediment metagenome]